MKLKQMNKIKNLIYKEQTDEESYQNIKKMYRENSKIIMNPKKWKNERLIQLKREGKIWSK